MVLFLVFLFLVSFNQPIHCSSTTFPFPSNMSIYSIYPVNNIYLFCFMLPVLSVLSVLSVACMCVVMRCFLIYTIQYFFCVWNVSREVVLLLFEFIELFAVNGIDVRMCASTLRVIRFQRIQTRIESAQKWKQNGKWLWFFLRIVFSVLARLFPFLFMINMNFMNLLWVFFFSTRYSVLQLEHEWHRSSLVWRERNWITIDSPAQTNE